MINNNRVLKMCFIDTINVLQEVMISDNFFSYKIIINPNIYI